MGKDEIVEFFGRDPLSEEHMDDTLIAGGKSVLAQKIASARDGCTELVVEAGLLERVLDHYTTAVYCSAPNHEGCWESHLETGQVVRDAIEACMLIAYGLGAEILDRRAGEVSKVLDDYLESKGSK